MHNDFILPPNKNNNNIDNKMLCVTNYPHVKETRS